MSELVDRLGVIRLLDAAIGPTKVRNLGPTKVRNRGYTGGELLVGLAAVQLAGEDFLVGLDVSAPMRLASRVPFAAYRSTLPK